MKQNIGKVCFIMLVLAVVVGLLYSCSSKQPQKADATTPQPTATNDKKSAATKAMGSNGWESYQWTFIIEEQKDNSTAGQGGFTDLGIKNPDQMVSFLKSTKTGAKALLDKIQKDASVTEKEVLDKGNWVAIQVLVDNFRYPGNTMLSNGAVLDAGQRLGKKGDIFLLFISSTGKIVAVRGACANPQVVIPKPPIPANTPKPKPTSKPIPTPSPKPGPTPVPTLKPKSSDPGDYKHPGDGDERDSGKNTKPPVPIVTSTAEPNPPVVVTKSPVVTPAPNSTPRPVPSPEPGVNPTSIPNPFL